MCLASRSHRASFSDEKRTRRTETCHGSGRYGRRVTDVVVKRHRYGAILLDRCDETAFDFFSRDVSSVDGDLSYDDLAMQDRPDDFDDTDAATIRRGMGLDRHPKSGWKWLVEQAPTALVSALPPDEDLGGVPDERYVELRPAVEAALRGFIGETGDRRGLAVATKMLHLKRPALIPICDSHTMTMLGIDLAAAASKQKRTAAGLLALDLVRQAARENENELARVGAYLSERGYPRTAIRVLDVLLWLAYGGRIRAGHPRSDRGLTRHPGSPDR